ncbi:MAG: YerC/YecD family TrpR-related protein, partial [Candidatus Magasanikbacteria bacterium]|nr:YerC/YecD family TrpR-related protein [Candidatus Magasanikbacteria bacterium]
RDLLTQKEIEKMGNRWQAAKMLDSNISYSIIEQQTGLSSTTVARISKWLNTGKGGYRLMIDRLHHL